MVIAGFEPLDVMQAILMLVLQNWTLPLQTVRSIKQPWKQHSADPAITMRQYVRTPR